MLLSGGQELRARALGQGGLEMAVINRGRFVLAGQGAGAVMNAVTLFASPLYGYDMFAILRAHPFSPPPGPRPVGVFLLMR